jgi:hypothetical protein
MLPLAFATSLGGMMTLLNTGNLVVSAALKQEGLRGLLFSFQSATLSKQHVSDERCVV